MAEEKTISAVGLYDNVLAEETGDFTGKTRITGTTRTSDISNRIVEKRTEYRPETITNILNLSYDEMIETLAQGRCVVNKFGRRLLTINGSFGGKKSDFRSPENRITVMFTPSTALLKALENVYVDANVTIVGPMVKNLADSTTSEKNLHITSNAPTIIFGSTLLIKGDDPSIGVYFTKDEKGVVPTKVSLIVRSTKNKIITQIPQLAKRWYWLSATTQAGTGCSLVKDPRTYKFPILPIIGAGGGGDSGSPGEIWMHSGVGESLYPG